MSFVSPPILGRTLAGAALAGAALAGGLLLAACRGVPDSAGAEAARALLLWVEEINTHLLVDPSAPLTAPAAVLPLDEARRALGLEVSALPPADGPLLVIVHRIHDHDRLVAERRQVLALAALPHRVLLPGGSAGWRRRLLPGHIRIEETAGDGLVLAVDGRRVALAPGDAWAEARIAGDPGPVPVDGGDAWRVRINRALDEGRPLTLLRILHRGWWRVEPAGGGG